jgi:glycosyltransferase involved in cell wall biosynthesis
VTAPALAPLPDGAGPRPLVSLVMPTWRRAHLIAESIESLLGQTEKDVELLVQDDASPDGTGAVVAALGDPRIRYARNAANLGMPGNVNAGIQRSRGLYVLVCHDHDLYAPTLVEQMVERFQETPGLAYVHAGVRVVDQTGAPAGRAWVGPYARVSDGRAWGRFMLTRFDSPVCADTMVPRQVYETAGLYDPAFGFVADVEMWMRLGLYGDVGYIAAPLIAVREREPGHMYFERRWEILETLVRIARAHQARLPGASWRALPLQGRIEAHLLRTLLSVVKHGGARELRKARPHLRRSPSLLCRAVAALVPA